MSARHSPAPWHIGFNDGTGRSYILDANGAVVVSGATDSWEVEHGVRNEADRRLIVESPNMLELVKIMASGGRISIRGQKRAQEILARVAGAP
jgi:hypothetical protein